MDELKLHVHQLQNVLHTLKNGLEHLHRVELMNDPDFILAAEDSLIQRFEYSYESMWKFLKKHLELTFDMQEINSPKKVFRACVEKGLCTFDEGKILIDMADDRNETSHRYSLEATRIILKDIPRYYEVMYMIVQRYEQE